MDAIAEKKSRNSRWSRDPVRGPDGSAVAVYPTERDIEIFKLLARYHYLPSDYVHAFVGGNPKALLHRLNLLSRKPNLYLTRPPQQRQCADANYRPLTYALDEAGMRALRERDLPVPLKSSRHNFIHELMIAQITASIELGTGSNPAIRLITWDEILANPTTPAATRALSLPNAIPVSYTLRGEARSDQIVADARPFGLERMVDGKRSFLFFPGIEADCGTEPIDAADPERSSIAKKFAAYLAIAEQGIHRSHFGFPNFFVPFITTTEVRLNSMMALVERLTGKQGSKILLFKTFPSLISPDRPPPAGGHMLTEPWQRIGFPPLRLDR
jgi:Replication-relaxation